MVRDDLCHLVRQVKKIIRLDSAPLKETRPLPDEAAGVALQSVSCAPETVDA